MICCANSAALPGSGLVAGLAAVVAEPDGPGCAGPVGPAADPAPGAVELEQATQPIKNKATRIILSVAESVPLQTAQVGDDSRKACGLRRPPRKVCIDAPTVGAARRNYYLLNPAANSLRALT